MTTGRCDLYPAWDPEFMAAGEVYDAAAEAWLDRPSPATWAVRNEARAAWMAARDVAAGRCRPV